MYQKPSAPRSIGGVLDNTLQLYKASFSKCWIPALLTGVVAAMLGLYQLRRMAVLSTSAISGTGFNGLAAQSLASSRQSWSLSLLGIFIELLCYAVMMYIITAISRGQPATVGSSFAATLRRLPAIIGAALIVGIISALGSGLALTPIMFVAARLPAGANPATILSIAGPVLLLCLVLALPVIYVISRMQLFLVALVGDSLGPLQSIAMSWRLIGGNWWRTTTTVFVMGVIAYILLLVVLGIAGTVAVMVVGVPAGPANVFGTVAIVGSITGGLTRLIYAPLFSAMYVAST